MKLNHYFVLFPSDWLPLIGFHILPLASEQTNKLNKTQKLANLGDDVRLSSDHQRLTKSMPIKIDINYDLFCLPTTTTTTMIRTWCVQWSNTTNEEVWTVSPLFPYVWTQKAETATCTTGSRQFRWFDLCAHTENWLPEWIALTMMLGLLLPVAVVGMNKLTADQLLYKNYEPEKSALARECPEKMNGWKWKMIFAKCEGNLACLPSRVHAHRTHPSRRWLPWWL